MNFKRLFTVLTGFVVLLLLYVVIPVPLDRVLISAHLLSGSTFRMTVSEVWISLGVIALFIEVVKAARLSARTGLESGLSVLVTMAYLVTFISMGKAGTATFFILMLLSAVDSIAGFVIALGSARTDVAISQGRTMR